MYDLRPIEMTELQEDAIREITTIGMGHASASLSRMTRKKIEIEVSKISLVPVEQVSSTLGRKNMLVIGSYYKFWGDITGNSLIFFSKNSALLLIDILNNREPGITKILTEDGKSTLGELGNILTGSYLASMGNFLNLSMDFSVPTVVFDIASAIVYAATSDIPELVNYSLVAQTEFISHEKSINGCFVLLLNDISLKKVLQTIEEKLKSVGVKFE